jgi:hypothetical protein
MTTSLTHGLVALCLFVGLLGAARLRWSRRKEPAGGSGLD